MRFSLSLASVDRFGYVIQRINDNWWYPHPPKGRSRGDKEYEKNLPMVPCEASKIQQVMLNILRNGAQAMESHDAGNDYTPCFNIRLTTEKDAGMMRIEIQDNGPGMTEKTRKKIFEPFYTTKAVGEGTGLGLSVSYFIIVENHGGTMDVVSSPGKGAKFIIRLPLKTRSNPRFF